MGGKTIIINPGYKYGKLTVVRELPKVTLPSGQYNRIILCSCECGNFTKVRLLHLVRLRVRSCGCLSGDKSGDAGKKGLYNTWRAMKNRCKPEYFNSKIYHKKGISVCDEWGGSYLAFKKWALNNGYKTGLHIDRINNSKGYHPGNCHFVTNMVNANNRDDTFYVNYKGRKIALMLLLREIGKIKHAPAIRSRISRGWNHEKAIDTEIRKGNYAKSK